MNSDQTAEQVLDAFAAEPVHTRETVEQYISKYPELRLELLELASEIRLVSDEGQLASEIIEDPGARDAWSTFSSIGTTNQRASNLFARFKGKQFGVLCSQLGLPRGFMIAIRDKRVRLNSIPERFLAVAAKAMGTGVGELRRYLDDTPRVLSTAEFKADQKPMAIEQITFEQLIRDTELSDEQRNTALEYLEDDRPD